MYNEVPLVLTSVAYSYLQGYPFVTYGDTVFILIQNIILVFLLWKYSKPAVSFPVKAQLLGAFVVLAAVSFSLSSQYQTYLQLFNLPLLAAARLPQIWANYKAKSTGQLSFISAFLSFGGALARMFTTIQDIGWDIALLSSYLIAATINGIIVSQIAYYYLLSRKNNTSKKSSKKEN